MVMKDAEIKEIAKEISERSYEPCSECWQENIVYGEEKELLTEDEFIEKYCSHCEMVVAIDPETMEYTIDSYQYLQRITGMLIHPIPLEADEIINLIEEYLIEEYKHYKNMEE